VQPPPPAASAGPASGFAPTDALATGGFPLAAPPGAEPPIGFTPPRPPTTSLAATIPPTLRKKPPGGGMSGAAIAVLVVLAAAAGIAGAYFGLGGAH
ncbi:MAG TPA: hypothetical protein VFS00_20220, partial [Polyangiaceae bacterium]|nr:hypothetical protein [Polyangiaceae bacterium]